MGGLVGQTFLNDHNTKNLCCETHIHSLCAFRLLTWPLLVEILLERSLGAVLWSCGFCLFALVFSASKASIVSYLGTDARHPAERHKRHTLTKT